MSRKSRAPRRIFYPESRYQSLVLSKFINFIMYGGKKTAAEKIIYTALDQIKNKTKEDPIKIFNDAINNISKNEKNALILITGSLYFCGEVLNMN